MELKEMKQSVKARIKELDRQTNVTAIESMCLSLKVGASKEHKILDLQSYQRVRTRLTRLKSETGFEWETELVGNKVKITRKS